MRCITCPESVVGNAVYCHTCEQAMERAKAAGFLPSDFEGLPLFVRFHNSVAFDVHSEKGQGWYTVGHDYAECVACSCKAREFNQAAPCKHMIVGNAVLERYHTRKATAHYGESPLGTTPSFNLFR